MIYDIVNIVVLTMIDRIRNSAIGKRCKLKDNVVTKIERGNALVVRSFVKNELKETYENQSGVSRKFGRGLSMRTQPEKVHETTFERDQNRIVWRSSFLPTLLRHGTMAEVNVC